MDFSFRLDAILRFNSLLFEMVALRFIPLHRLDVCRRLDNENNQRTCHLIEGCSMHKLLARVCFGRSWLLVGCMRLRVPIQSQVFYQGVFSSDATVEDVLQEAVLQDITETAQDLSECIQHACVLVSRAMLMQGVLHTPLQDNITLRSTVSQVQFQCRGAGEAPDPIEVHPPIQLRVEVYPPIGAQFSACLGHEPQRPGADPNPDWVIELLSDVFRQ